LSLRAAPEENATNATRSSARRCSAAKVRRIARGIEDHSWTLMNTDGAGFWGISGDEWFFRGVVTMGCRRQSLKGALNHTQ
jgi:hypothetical protein